MKYRILQNESASLNIIIQEEIITYNFFHGSNRIKLYKHIHPSKLHLAHCRITHNSGTRTIGASTFNMDSNGPETSKWTCNKT